MEKPQVNFELGGRGIGSKYWGYTAWHSTLLQKSAFAELVDNKYVVYILDKREELPTNPLPDFSALDDRMYRAIKYTAERAAKQFGTTVNDTATAERESQSVSRLAHIISHKQR